MNYLFADIQARPFAGQVRMIQLSVGLGEGLKIGIF